MENYNPFETAVQNPFEVNQPIQQKYPDSKQVKGIFSDIYIFYCKYEKQESINWEDFHSEMVGLSHTYPFDMATQMLIEVAHVIEQRFKEGAM